MNGDKTGGTREPKGKKNRPAETGERLRHSRVTCRSATTHLLHTRPFVSPYVRSSGLMLHG